MYLRLGPYKVLHVWLYKPMVNFGTPLHLNTSIYTTCEVEVWMVGEAEFFGGDL
jgi:hypothetical protein